MTYETKITNELIANLEKVFNKWKNKYGINNDDVFYSDGEYDPNLSTVLANIQIYFDE
jgi:hypothetical protein